jgi:hypothetical protein
VDPYAAALVRDDFNKFNSAPSFTGTVSELASLGPFSVYAHGGVAIEFDECVVRIGKFTQGAGYTAR